MNKQLLTKILIAIGGLVVLGLVINLLVSADQPPTLPKITCGLTTDPSVTTGSTIAFHPDCRANLNDPATIKWEYNIFDENGPNTTFKAKSATKGDVSLNGGPDEKVVIPALFVDIPADAELNHIKVYLRVGETTRMVDANIIHNPYLQLKKGYNIVYLPYSLKNADKKTSDFIASLSAKNSQVVNWIRRWDGQLQTWFDAAKTASVASPLGKGLYVYAKQDIAKIDINDMFSLIDENQPITVPVYKGWNLIGNPYFRYSPTLANMTVKINGQAVDWVTAANNINVYAMTEKGNMGSFWVAGATSSLNRFEGFWIKMPEAGEIIWNKSGTPPTPPTQEDNGAPTTEGNTDVTVTQNSGIKITDTTVNQPVADRVDLQLTISGQANIIVSTYKNQDTNPIKTNDFGQRQTGSQTFNLAPEYFQGPGSYRITAVAEANGQTSSKTASITLINMPTQSTPLTIGNLTAVKVLSGANKGVSIDYNISTNALVTMKIYKKATSVLVRTLVNNVNKTGGGTYTEKWDVKGDHPNGGGTFVDLSADTYRIELTAKKDQSSAPVTRTTDITLSLNDMISIRN